MKKENLAALLIAGALLNISACAMPAHRTAQDAPREELVTIGRYDIKPARESIQALPEAEEVSCSEIPNDSINNPVIPESSNRTLKVLATAYCGCSYCCGKSDCITATGTRATEGRTIAVDPRMIPYGTHVLINGHEYVAEDCGGDIQNSRVDIYFESHVDANAFGKQWVELEVLG